MLNARIAARSFAAFGLLALGLNTLVLAYGPAVFSHYAGTDPAVSKPVFAVITFLLDLTLVAGVIGGLGFAVTGYLSGILISGWNDYSLSRLQMTLWTVLVVAAVLTVAKIRILAGAPEPLQFEIPADLLAAMGIAAASTVAAPAILALKAAQPGDPALAAAAARRGGGDAGAGGMIASGRAVGRLSRDSASWIDMVTGDEVANAGVVDLSKVQQLLITLLLVGAYAGQVIAMLAKGGPVEGLPGLSGYFISLLAISHAGYLAYKAAPKAGAQPGLDGAQSAAPVARAAPASLDVPVRLAIADAQHLSSLSLEVDGKPITVPPSGFIELPLVPGRSHLIAGRAMRAGAPVRGQLAVTPDQDDYARPLLLELG